MPRYGSRPMASAFLILHGLSGSGPGHWQRWLAERLAQDGHTVHLPELPDRDRAVPRGVAPRAAGRARRTRRRRARGRSATRWRASLARCAARSPSGRSTAWRSSPPPVAWARGSRRSNLLPGHRRPRDGRSRAPAGSHAARLLPTTTRYCPEGAAALLRRAARACPIDLHPGARRHLNVDCRTGAVRRRAEACGSAARRTASRRNARRSPAAPPRSACPASPGRAATCSAPHSAAPHESPQSTPSRRAASARRLDRGLVGHGDDLVEDLAVQHRRHEAGADALDLVRPGGPPESTGGARGLDRDDLRLGVALLEHLAHAGDRPAGPDAGHEHVDARRRAPRGSPARSCAGGSRGSPGWRTGRAGSTSAIASPSRGRRRPPRSCRPSTR